MTLHTVSVNLQPVQALMLMTEQSKRQDTVSFTIGYTFSNYLTLEMFVDGVDTAHKIRLNADGTWGFETHISLGEKE